MEKTMFFFHFGRNWRTLPVMIPHNTKVHQNWCKVRLQKLCRPLNFQNNLHGPMQMHLKIILTHLNLLIVWEENPRLKQTWLSWTWCMCIDYCVIIGKKYRLNDPESCSVLTLEHTHSQCHLKNPDNMPAPLHLAYIVVGYQGAKMVNVSKSLGSQLSSYEAAWSPEHFNTFV